MPASVPSDPSLPGSASDGWLSLAAMPGDFALFDWSSAAIVIGGTLLATVLRSGRADLAATGRALAGLRARAFSYDDARAQVAHAVEDLRHDGLYRPGDLPRDDAETAEALDALVTTRSLDALGAVHDASARRRRVLRNGALRVLQQGAELAPVFGMAGTLVALAQVPQGGYVAGAMAGAVARAVLTTLYGLLLAHLVLMPLARYIERRGKREDEDRDRLVHWLSEQLAEAVPHEELTRPVEREAA
ncbi:MotA/TolQ/ExbB proton channel family protein [uncultured Croceicoccus sp.]|uniref:MotA/TolQ/ExbB proton channel family protein n=1 Tax=uncultured Croceicoccus sp. TaxID=1295329 RepID=UPI002636BF8A|nr:MotA/TolQ/ExbB proton channel family protein [uncultured Croceicoccus sp.]